MLRSALILGPAHSAPLLRSPPKRNPRFLLREVPPLETRACCGPTLALPFPVLQCLFLPTMWEGRGWPLPVVTSSLLPIPQLGGPAAADGDARADWAGQPADAPAEDEVSTASQWADHARFAHAPLGTHPQPGVPQGWQGQICTRPLGCARQSTHLVTPRCTTHIPSAHRLCSFTPDSLCIPRTQLRTSYTPILLTWLNSELGHGRPGPTRHTPARSFLWPPKRTRVHTH